MDMETPVILENSEDGSQLFTNENATPTQESPHIDHNDYSITERQGRVGNIESDKKITKKVNLHRDTVSSKYISWFNDEVKHSLFSPIFNHDLKKSSLHINSRVENYAKISGSDKLLSSDEDLSDEESDREDFPNSVVADGDDLEQKEISDTSISPKEVEVGVEWTEIEKQVFFHCLSRYSINLIDDWYLQIPTKSKFEILIYYEILRKTYDEIKSKSLNQYLIKRKDLPIAYEMDETWVTLENDIVESMQDEQQMAPGHQQQSDDGLIDFSKWEKRWESVYSKNGLLEYYPIDRECPKVDSTGTAQTLEKLVKSFCTNLLMEIVSGVDENDESLFELVTGEPSNQENSQKNGDFIAQSHENDTVSQRLMLTIKLEDVHRGIINMKRNPAKYGIHPYTLSEQVPDTLCKFQLHTDAEGINMIYNSIKKDSSGNDTDMSDSSSNNDTYDMGLFKSAKTKTGQVPALIYKTLNDRCPLFDVGEQSSIFTRGSIAAPDYSIPHRLANANSQGQQQGANNSNSCLTTSTSWADFPRSQEFQDLLREQSIDDKDLAESTKYQQTLLEYFNNVSS